MDTVYFLIGSAYILIPVEVLVSLYCNGKLTGLSQSWLGACFLVMLNFVTVGVGYLLVALAAPTALWETVDCTISLITALYLVPLLPQLISQMDCCNTVNQELLQLNEETAASKRKLFTFMNFLCHEIRNPLFAITSNIEFAQDLPMNPDLYESLSAINQSASLMLRLVNDVLDLSKIESGKLELEKQEFDLRDFFQNMAASMSRQVSAKRHGAVKFIFNMAPEVPRIVQSDSTRLLQICQNILSNASKFTERGAITLTVDIDDQQDDQVPNTASTSTTSEGTTNEESEKRRKNLSRNDSTDNFSLSDVTSLLDDSSESSASVDPDLKVVTLRLSFEDTGIGIEEDHLERIFQPYTQSKLSDFRRHGGTGLGLSIIHRLLGMMEGKVTVTSVVGEGTKFVLHIPIVVIQEEPQQSDNDDGQPKAMPRSNSYAKLGEMDMYDSEEENDHITPLSSTPHRHARSHNNNKYSVESAGAIGLGTLAPERDDAATPQVRNTGASSAIRLGMLPPERSESATPQINNTCRSAIRLGMLPPERSESATPQITNTCGSAIRLGMIPPERAESSTPQIHNMGGRGGLRFGMLSPSSPDLDEEDETMDHQCYAQQHLLLFQHPQSQIHPMFYPSEGQIHPQHFQPFHPEMMHPQHQPQFIHHAMDSLMYSNNPYLTMGHMEPTPEEDEMDLTPMHQYPMQNPLHPPHGPLFALSGSMPELEGVDEDVSSNSAPLSDDGLAKPLFALAPLAQMAAEDTEGDMRRLQPPQMPANPLFPLASVDCGGATLRHPMYTPSPLEEDDFEEQEGDLTTPKLPASVQAPKAQRLVVGKPRAVKPSSRKEKLAENANAVLSPQELCEQLTSPFGPPKAKMIPSPICPVSNTDSAIERTQQPGSSSSPISNGLFQIQPLKPTPTLPNLIPNKNPSQPTMKPTTMVVNQVKAPQFAKFDFPKNINMVLVVDDNGVNRKLIGKTLSFFNLAYQDAENGKMAVEIMERSQNVTGDPSAPLFGLVIMDLCMPVMNGYHAIEKIRNELKLDVPIVALTASAMEDEQKRAMDAGATEFATKPLLRPTLHQKCTTYLKPLEEEEEEDDDDDEEEEDSQSEHCEREAKAHTVTDLATSTIPIASS